MKLLVAADHAGYALKKDLIESRPDLEWVDLGPDNDERVDYPDFADKVAFQVNNHGGKGVLICGSAQGMAMRANRYPGVRAAVCWDEESTRLARSHNDANILCLPARRISSDTANELLQVFLDTEFEGGRHQNRVDKLKGELL